MAGSKKIIKNGDKKIIKKMTKLEFLRKLEWVTVIVDQRYGLKATHAPTGITLTKFWTNDDRIMDIRGGMEKELYDIVSNTI